VRSRKIVNGETPAIGNISRAILSDDIALDRGPTFSHSSTYNSPRAQWLVIMGLSIVQSEGDDRRPNRPADYITMKICKVDDPTPM